MNYHILTMENADRLSVVFHFSVPDQLNYVGINLRLALKEYLESEGGGAIQSQCPFIDPAELVQIQNGEIYEHFAVVEFNAHLTKAEKRDVVDGRWIDLQSIVVSKIEQRLDFWGYNRDVP